MATEMNYDKIRHFFSDEVWDAMPDIERTANLARFNAYVSMLMNGCPMKAPAFMSPEEPKPSRKKGGSSTRTQPKPTNPAPTRRSSRQANLTSIQSASSNQGNSSQPDLTSMESGRNCSSDNREGRNDITMPITQADNPSPNMPNFVRDPTPRLPSPSLDSSVNFSSGNATHNSLPLRTDAVVEDSTFDEFPGIHSSEDLLSLRSSSPCMDFDEVMSSFASANEQSEAIEDSLSNMTRHMPRNSSSLGSPSAVYESCGPQHTSNSQQREGDDLQMSSSIHDPWNKENISPTWGETQAMNSRAAAETSSTAEASSTMQSFRTASSLFNVPRCLAGPSALPLQSVRPASNFVRTPAVAPTALPEHSSVRPASILMMGPSATSSCHSLQYGMRAAASSASTLVSVRPACTQSTRSPSLLVGTPVSPSTLPEQSVRPSSSFMLRPSATSSSHTYQYGTPATASSSSALPAVRPGCSRGSSASPHQQVIRLIQERLAELSLEYNILEIIQASKDPLLRELDENGIVYGAERKRFITIITDHLISEAGSVLNVTTRQREAAAISIVKTLPKMRKHLVKESDRPWHHFFGEGNMGFLAHSIITNQRSLKRKTGQGVRNAPSVPKGPKVPRKLLPPPDDTPDDSPDPVSFVQDVSELSQTMPTIGNKANVLHLMSQTYTRRREKMAKKELNTGRIIEGFPHFLSYHGELIEQEFNTLYPSRQGVFFREFMVDMVPKILAIVKDDQKFMECVNWTSNDALNALYCLTKFLPTPRRTFEHERKMPLHARTSDLLFIVPLGSDPQQQADQRRSESEYMIQPHLMTVGNGRDAKIFLVLGDSKLLELSRAATLTNATDLLLKSFFVFSAYFPLGWKNAFRFLQLYVYKIPLDSARESSFPEHYLRLKNMSIQ
ncbi:uncharacterized protein LOC117638947 isoform X2 [Thrips palmi]|uniref:Uncharacterized protein LOC117638947 isoform X2 n=1 Tax=Thrips palmi TaxID=161013 RepID=A0A6P8XT72_THRPL|nr:uncharacterized protein LOC117638947 isoform X2 [Thrips palmi]